MTLSSDDTFDDWGSTRSASAVDAPQGNLAGVPAAVEALKTTIIAGRYRVKRLLGAGGMGYVCAARDVDAGGWVAIKVLRPNALDATSVRRFRREARAAALVHDNVCGILDTGVLPDGSPFLAMELLDGEPLSRRIESAGAMSVSDAVCVMRQLLDGLAAAHARGVLHRDVKPGNVFLCRGLHVKLIDFGLARMMPAWCGSAGETEDTNITLTGQIAGTPSYVSPEQINAVGTLDERTDIWGAGLVLYEMLTGHRAFRGGSYQALAGRILLEAPSPVRWYRSDVPFEVEAVLERALAKERCDRFADAASFRHALLEAARRPAPARRGGP